MGNQILLFRNVDVKRLDSILTELSNMIYALKSFALLVEISQETKSTAHYALLDAVVDIAGICAELSDVSLQYLDVPKEEWKRKTVYDPYYAAIDQRSPRNLYEVSSDYKSRCNRLLMRLGACLEEAAIKMPVGAHRLMHNLEKTKRNLYKNGFED